MKKANLLIIFTFSFLSLWAQDSNEDIQYQKALDLIELDSSKTAFSILSNLLDKNPGHLDALITRGKLLYFQQHYKEAVTDFTQAIEIDAKQEETYTFRAKCWHNLNEGEKAIKDIDTALLLGKSSYRLGVKGIFLMDERRYQEALNTFNEAIALVGDDSFLYFKKGVCLEKLQMFSEAIEAYSIAIQWDANYDDAYIYRADLNSYLSNYKQALSDINIAIDLDSTYSKAYVIRGNIKIELEDLNGALSDIDKAIKLSPKYAYAFMLKGEALLGLDKLDKAVAAYDQAIEINPNYTYALIRKGIALEENNKRKEAYDCYQKAIDIDPEYGFAYFRLGLLQKDEVAEKTFTKAEGYLPNYYSLFFERSFVRLRLKNYDGAIDDLKKVIELNPDYTAKAYYYIANIYSEKKQYNEAITYYNKSYEINNNLRVQFSIAMTYGRLGKAEEARDTYFELIQHEKNNPNPNGFLWSTIYNNIAYSYIKEDELKKAKKYLKIALKNAGDESYIYGNNGIYLFKKGNFEKALVFFNKAISLNENQKGHAKNQSPFVTYYYRGLTHLKLNNTEQACKDLSKSGELGYMKAYDVIKENCNSSR